MRTCPADSQNHNMLGEQSVPDTDVLHKNVRLGLQICRANTLSLTRLQFALQNGDRRCVLEAIDRLQDLDTQIGRLLKQLPVSATDDPELHAFCRQVDQQSMEVAFEKLAFVSEVSGPDMVTTRKIWDDFEQIGHSNRGDPEGSDEDSMASSKPYWIVLGTILALVALMTIATTVGSHLLAGHAG